MAFIWSGMNRDSLSTKTLTIQRYIDEVWIIPTPGISEGGYFIYIDTESGHLVARST